MRIGTMDVPRALMGRKLRAACIKALASLRERACTAKHTNQRTAGDWATPADDRYVLAIVLVGSLRAETICQRESLRRRCFTSQRYLSKYDRTMGFSPGGSSSSTGGSTVP